MQQLNLVIHPIAFTTNIRRRLFAVSLALVPDRAHRVLARLASSNMRACPHTTSRLRSLPSLTALQMSTTFNNSPRRAQSHILMMLESSVLPWFIVSNPEIRKNLTLSAQDKLPPLYNRNWTIDRELIIVRLTSGRLETRVSERLDVWTPCLQVQTIRAKGMACRSTFLVTQGFNRQPT